MVKQDFVILDKSFERSIENFPWERVEKAMHLLDWKWIMGKGEERIPSQQDMQWTVNALYLELKEALDNETIETGDCISSGGFAVSNRKNMVKIEFVVASCLGY